MDTSDLAALRKRMIASFEGGEPDSSNQAKPDSSQSKVEPYWQG